jgi:hypothetical protein
MYQDLEAIVAADEESRSRMTLAEARRDRDLSTARAKRDSELEKRRSAARAALDSELQAIRSDGDVRLHDLREQQKHYLAALAETGEQKFAEAVQLYSKIVYQPEGQ